MTRVSVTIEVECDPVPGSFHEPEDWQRYFEDHCQRSFPHYYPAVTGFRVLEDGTGDDKGGNHD